MKESFQDKPNMSPADIAMNRELDKLGDEMVDREYKELVGSVKQERDILHEMTSYVRSYIISHKHSYDLEMSLGEFLEKMEVNKDFDLQILKNIYDWIDSKEGKINFEKSVEYFLTEVEEVLKEDELLLSPGPEKE